MAVVVLIWIGLGALVGLLAHPARLWPSAWGSRSWLVLAGLGAGGAVLGGVLGALLVGLLYATAAALAASVLLAAAGPWLASRTRRLA